MAYEGHLHRYSSAFRFPFSTSHKYPPFKHQLGIQARNISLIEKVEEIGAGVYTVLDGQTKLVYKEIARPFYHAKDTMVLE